MDLFSTPAAYTTVDALGMRWRTPEPYAYPSTFRLYFPQADARAVHTQQTTTLVPVPSLVQDLWPTAGCIEPAIATYPCCPHPYHYLRLFLYLYIDVFMYKRDSPQATEISTRVHDTLNSLTNIGLHATTV